MTNKITEKFFTQEDFSQRAADVLAQVCAETGFVVEQEIFRGIVYNKSKVGSLIYQGTFGGKPAVLKLQGLRPEVDEAEIVQRFTAQSRSTLVRVPALLAHRPWIETRGYGYLITDYLDAPKIFTMPFASAEQMHAFARFYQEYRTAALTRSWMEPDASDSLALTVRRVDHWRRISEHTKRLALAAYAPYLVRYYPLAVKHLPSIPLVFCHGHLTADDIYCLEDGSFVVLSNLFWSFRPQWYDLAFNIWSCVMHIRNADYSFEQLLQYVDAWLAVYHTIPVVQRDGDFERKISTLLLERTIGAILVDLGASDSFGKAENTQLLYHLLGLQQQWFDHLARKLKMMPPVSSGGHGG